MKRASYRDAIDWIAYNDDEGSGDALNPNVVSGQLTSCLVAEIFGVTRTRVGQDVVQYRKKNHITEE